MVMPLHMLQAWIYAFMISVVPLNVQVKFRGETSEEKAKIRYESIAADIAYVTTDEKAAPLHYRQFAAERTALWLAAQAFCESAFDRRVDEGRCAPGTCDNGTAWGLWQIHAERGLTFEGLTFKYASERDVDWKLDHLAEIYRGVHLVRDRKLAARMALHMRRVSPYNWTSWKCARDSADLYFQRNVPK